MIRAEAQLPKPFNDRAMMDTLEKELTDKVGKFMKDDVERMVTNNWKGEKPNWVVHTAVNPYRITVSVVPEPADSKGALKYLWLDEGTKPHPIRPVNAKVLAFPAAYSAGSSPGSPGERPMVFSGRSSGPTVFAQEVMHPGIKARNWSAYFINNWSKTLRQMLDGIMIRVARASGHGG